MEDRGPSAYIAEFLGTLILVFAVGTVLAVHAGPAGLDSPDFAVIGLVHVFVLAMLIHALGGTSGAHFNPAVTAVMIVLKKIRAVHGAIYVLLQLAGAVAGALLVRILLEDEGDAVAYGAVGVGDFLSGSAGLGFLTEAIGTFLLVFAIFAAAVNPRASASAAPWIIGATLGMAVMILGPLTGAGFNPARALGPAVVGDAFGSAGDWLVVYVLGPVVGAVAAGVAYTKLVLEPQETLFGGRLVDADVPPGRVPGEVEAALDGPGERPVDKLS